MQDLRNRVLDMLKNHVLYTVLASVGAGVQFWYSKLVKLVLSSLFFQLLLRIHLKVK